ncbi:hypothetical protein LEP1GSC126_0087 [Leptospira kirschneri str. 200801774]|nr:hypothetical protein LEP1GSC126_0087 [Leptospira kirschneri str. 200801774]
MAMITQNENVSFIKNRGIGESEASNVHQVMNVESFLADFHRSCLTGFASSAF